MIDFNHGPDECALGKAGGGGGVSATSMTFKTQNFGFEGRSLSGHPHTVFNCGVHWRGDKHRKFIISAEMYDELDSLTSNPAGVRIPELDYIYPELPPRLKHAGLKHLQWKLACQLTADGACTNEFSQSLPHSANNPIHNSFYDKALAKVACELNLPTSKGKGYHEYVCECYIQGKHSTDTEKHKRAYAKLLKKSKWTVELGWTIDEKILTKLSFAGTTEARATVLKELSRLDSQIDTLVANATGVSAIAQDLCRAKLNLLGMTQLLRASRSSTLRGGDPPRLAHQSNDQQRLIEQQATASHQSTDVVLASSFYRWLQKRAAHLCVCIVELEGMLSAAMRSVQFHAVPAPDEWQDLAKEKALCSQWLAALDKALEQHNAQHADRAQTFVGWCQTSGQIPRAELDKEPLEVVFGIVDAVVQTCRCVRLRWAELHDILMHSKTAKYMRVEGKWTRCTINQGRATTLVEYENLGRELAMCSAPAHQDESLRCTQVVHEAVCSQDPLYSCKHYPSRGLSKQLRDSELRSAKNSLRALEESGDASSEDIATAKAKVNELKSKAPKTCKCMLCQLRAYTNHRVQESRAALLTKELQHKRAYASKSSFGIVPVARLSLMRVMLGIKHLVWRTLNKVITLFFTVAQLHDRSSQGRAVDNFIRAMRKAGVDKPMDPDGYVFCKFSEAGKKAILKNIPALIFSAFSGATGAVLVIILEQIRNLLLLLESDATAVAKGEWQFRARAVGMMLAFAFGELPFSCPSLVKLVLTLGSDIEAWAELAVESGLDLKPKDMDESIFDAAHLNCLKDPWKQCNNKESLTDPGGLLKRFLTLWLDQFACEQDSPSRSLAERAQQIHNRKETKGTLQPQEADWSFEATQFLDSMRQHDAPTEPCWEQDSAALASAAQATTSRSNQQQNEAVSSVEDGIGTSDAIEEGDETEQGALLREVVLGDTPIIVGVESQHVAGIFEKHLRAIKLDSMIGLRDCDHGDSRFGADDPRRWLQSVDLDHNLYDRGLSSAQLLKLEFRSPAPTKLTKVQSVKFGPNELMCNGLTVEASFAHSMSLLRLNVKRDHAALARITFRYEDRAYAEVTNAEVKWMSRAAPLVEVWSKSDKRYLLESRIPGATLNLDEFATCSISFSQISQEDVTTVEDELMAHPATSEATFGWDQHAKLSPDAERTTAQRSRSKSLASFPIGSCPDLPLTVIMTFISRLPELAKGWDEDGEVRLFQAMQIATTMTLEELQDEAQEAAELAQKSADEKEKIEAQKKSDEAQRNQIDTDNKRKKREADRTLREASTAKLAKCRLYLNRRGKRKWEDGKWYDGEITNVRQSGLDIFKCEITFDDASDEPNKIKYGEFFMVDDALASKPPTFRWLDGGTQQLANNTASEASGQPLAHVPVNQLDGSSARRSVRRQKTSNGD